MKIKNKFNFLASKFNNKRFLRKWIFVRTMLLVLFDSLFPILVYYNKLQNPEIVLSQDIFSLIMIGIGHSVNVFTGAVLGEEIADEGFKAMIWSIFFSYLATVVLTVWYLIYIVTENPYRKRIEKISFRSDYQTNSA